MATRDGKITLQWPDEEREFRLRIGELRELQEKCGNRGPMTIFFALHNGTWLVDDVIQPVRLGLIGAGMSQGDALKLVNTHLSDGRLKEGVMVAQAILIAAVTGPPDEHIKAPTGEGKPPRKKSETPTPSSSRSSTGTAGRRGSRPTR